jgi:adenylate cyclase
MQQIDCGASPEEIRAQAQKILASEGFVRCRRMQRFLEFVVAEALAGRAGQLGEYAIGVAVFDRGEDFEPALDPIVRNDARRLRSKLSEYYRAATHAGDRVVIEVPKGGYVPVFLTVQANAARVAVLPFEVISVDEYGWKLGRSLGASLVASLTGLDGVEAIAHGYSQDLSAREAAAELRASHVIRGSILQFGERHSITINLIQAADGTQLWAREYEVEECESLSFRREIVSTVQNEVAARLAGGPPQRMSLAMAA